MHEADHQTLRTGTILKDRIELNIQELEADKSDYLAAMLTGDTTKGRFFSFYSMQIDSDKAKVIVDNFTMFLAVYGRWRLFVVEPDFLKDTYETYAKDEKLRYFRGDFGNNSATLILTDHKGFLLLTNGID